MRRRKINWSDVSLVSLLLLLLLLALGLKASDDPIPPALRAGAPGDRLRSRLSLRNPLRTHVCMYPRRITRAPAAPHRLRA